MKRSAIVFLLFTIFLTVIPVVEANTNNSASLDGIQIFPKDHIWNVPIDTLPVDSRSATYINSIGTSTYLRAEFDNGGIPYNIVDNSQETYMVDFGSFSEN